MKTLKFWHGVLALVLTFAVLSGSVIFTLAFRPLYYRDIKALHIEAHSGISEAEIRENYDALIDYNMSWEKGLLTFPTLPQSTEGQIHFQEVKDIFDLFKYIGIGSLLLGAIGILIMRGRGEYLYLKYTSVLAVALPAAVGCLVAIDWQRAFVLFHEIAFDNDFWIFDPATDPVIEILPNAFFLHCAILILCGIVVGSLVSGLLYRFIKTRQK